MSRREKGSIFKAASSIPIFLILLTPKIWEITLSTVFTRHRGLHPTHQPIRHIASITARRTTRATQVFQGRAGTRIIQPRRLVELLRPVPRRLIDQLHETGPIWGPRAKDAVVDHLPNVFLETGLPHLNAHSRIVASARSGLGLHEAWVSDTSDRGVDTNATARFLNYDGQDEAFVEFGFFGSIMYGFVDLRGFVGSIRNNIVQARRANRRIVAAYHGGKGLLCLGGWPVAAVSGVVVVSVRKRACAVGIVDCRHSYIASNLWSLGDR